MPIVPSNAKPTMRSAQSNVADTQNAKNVGARIGFARASKLHTEFGQTLSAALTSSSSTLSFRVPVNGYLNKVYLYVSAPTSGNAATVAFQPDAPWSLLQNVQLRDSSGTQIWNLTGYQLFLATKWGGYRTYRYDQSAFGLTQTAGAGATGGTIQYVLSLPIGFGRDALGVLPNMDASSPYILDVTLAPSSAVYSTAPTTLPTVSLQIGIESRMAPDATDLFGNAQETTPPALGTAQFWSVYSQPVVAGDNTISLPRVGNYMRNIGIVTRNAGGARANLLTGTFVLEFDTFQLYQTLIPVWQTEIYSKFGYDLDTGVLWFPFTLDPDNLPGNEYGDMWLPTLNTTRLVVRATSSAAGVMEIITNDIVGSGNIFAS